MLINSPNISGSLKVTGNTVITGSLTVLGGINATITGSATSASYVEYTNVANKPTLVSGSSQISFNGITDKPTLVSGSSQITYSGLSGIPSGIISSSTQITGYNIFATTGSNQFNGSQAITGSLTVTGQVVAQTLNVQQVTSSIVYSSGSNIFGNSLANTQQFTGSLQVSGSSHNILGNVGIGTTPSTFLHVFGANTSNRGQLSIQSNNSSNAAKATWYYDTTLQGEIGTTSGDFYALAVNNFLFYAGGAERMRITSGGNVLIGGTVVQNSSANRGNLTINGTTSILNLSTSDTNAGYLYHGGTDMLLVNAKNGATLFYTNDTERMRITSGGNVGIGSDSITNGTTFGGGGQINRLKVQSTNYTCLEINGSTSGGSVQFTYGTNSPNQVAGIIGYNYANGAANEFAISNILSGPLIFATSNTERMRITSGGEVGINVTPSAGNRFWIKTSDSSSSNTALIAQNSAGSWIIFARNDGNVGIGTASPSQRLQVENSANAFIRTLNSAIANGTQSGIIVDSSWSGSDRGVTFAMYKHSSITNPASYISFYSGGSAFQYMYMDDSNIIRISSSSSDIGTSGGTIVGTQTSDIRLKNVKESFSYGLEDILKINPIAFTFKNDANNTDKLGFSAQEMINIIPESVYDTRNCVDGYEDTDDPMIKIPKSDDTILAMDYSILIPVLVKAIQEQQSQIEILKTKIEILEQS